MVSIGKKGMTVITVFSTVLQHVSRAVSSMKLIVFAVVSLAMDMVSKVQQRCTQRRRCRVLLLGLDNAGKTTICHRLQQRYTWPSQPRPGHHVLHTRCSIDDVAFHFMDPSGDGSQEASRKNLWAHCLNGSVDAVALVVDVADRKRLPEAKAVLKWLLDQEVVRERNMPVLILGNKEDSAHAISALQLQKALGLMGLTTAQRVALLDAEPSVLHLDIRRRIASFHPDEAIVPLGNSPITLRMCCASQSVGVHEAMLWLARSVKPHRGESLYVLLQRNISCKISLLNQHVSCIAGAIRTLSSTRDRLGISHFGRHARLLPTHVA